MSYNPENGPPQTISEEVQNLRLLQSHKVFFSKRAETTGVSFSLDHLIAIDHVDSDFDKQQRFRDYTIEPIKFCSAYPEYPPSITYPTTKLHFRSGMYLDRFNDMQGSTISKFHFDDTSRFFLRPAKIISASEGAQTVGFTGLARKPIFRNLKTLEGEEYTTPEKEWCVFDLGSVHKSPSRDGKFRLFARGIQIPPRPTY